MRLRLFFWFTPFYNVFVNKEKGKDLEVKNSNPNLCFSGDFFWFLSPRIVRVLRYR